MDPLATLLKGLVIGLAVAAPVGPIGMLCIQRTLAGGTRLGFASGLGAAVADAGYAAIAALGIGTVMRILEAQARAIRIGGGILLLLIALQTLRRASDAPAARAALGPAGLATAFTSVAVLTLANPATILSFVAIFAGVGDVAARHPLALVAGVFIGSTAWWLFLATATGLLRARVTPRIRRLIDIVSAACLAGFGLVALVAALR